MAVTWFPGVVVKLRREHVWGVRSSYQLLVRGCRARTKSVEHLGIAQGQRSSRRASNTYVKQYLVEYEVPGTRYTIPGSRYCTRCNTNRCTTTAAIKVHECSWCYPLGRERKRKKRTGMKCALRICVSASEATCRNTTTSCFGKSVCPRYHTWCLVHYNMETRAEHYKLH